MKLNENFIVHKIGDETLLVPTGAADFRGLAQGNRTVDVILNCLLSDTDEESIVKALMDRFDGDEADIREDVAGILGQLRSIGAIDE